MKKAKLILTAVLCMFVCTCAQAAEYQDVIDEITNEHINSVYNIDLNAPFTKDTSGIQETVNPESGAVQVGVALFPMQGRGNNIPFTLNMQYSSQHSTDMLESVVYDEDYAIYRNTLASKSNLQKSIESVGIGWTFDLPYIEIPDTRNKSYTYVHMPDGSVYKTNENGLEEYLLKDVTFNVPTTDLSNESAQYSLIYVTGDSYYFNNNGYLVAQRDRFGNAVNFYWSEETIPKLTCISDNCGNAIYLTYTDTSVEITMNGRKYIIGRSVQGESYIVNSVTDPSGRITRFEYTPFDMTYNYMSSSEGENRYHLLSKVIYNNGLVTEYSYTKAKKWLYQAQGGYIEYAKITGRYEISGEPVSNNVTYSYTNEPDGYPNYKSNELPQGYTYSTTETNSNGKRITYKYDAKHNQIMRNISTPSRTAEVERIVYDGNTRMPYSVEKETLSPGGTSRIVYTKTTFDIYGNVTKTDTYTTAEEEGTDVREYKYGTSNLCVYESYMKDSDTKVEIKRSICPGGFAIASESVYENGNIILTNSYSYDASGNLTMSKEQTGRTTFLTTRYTYSAEHSNKYPETITQSGITDADGVMHSYKTTLAYDKYGNCISQTDNGGAKTLYKYDSANRVIQEILPDGGVRTYEYDDKANTILTADARKTKLLYLYDKYGRMKSVKDIADGINLMQREYDRNGRLVKEYDGNGNYTSYTYDALDRYTGVYSHNANGDILAETTLSYDEAYDGKYLKMYVISGTKPNQRKTEYLFDWKDRLIMQTAVSEEENRVYSYEYDISGNNTAVISPLGAETLYTYDIFGNAVYTRYPDGRTEEREYDYRGNCITFTNGEGNAEYYTYDSLSRPVKSVIDGSVTKTYYNWQNNAVKTVDPKGNITENTYTSRGLLQSSNMYNADSGITAEYTYDTEGGMLSMKTGETGAETRRGITYTLDRFGRVIKETDTLEMSTSYEYDAVGNIIRQTDRNGIVTTNTYDGLNRLIKTENSKSGIIEYEYNQFSEAVYATDGQETERVEYTPFGEVKAVYSNDTTEQFLYDADGNCILHTVDDKAIGITETGYEYSKGGLLTAVKTAIGTEYITYDRAGRVTGKNNQAAGIEKLYDYLPNGLVSRIRTTQNGTLVYNEEYQYDANGNKTYADENGIVTRYSYDSLNRISSVTENGDDITQYEYDGYNNISREYTLTDIGVKTKKYFYDGNNRLILSETEDNYITYDYDSAGNLIKKTDNGKTEYYGYDGYNRLNTYYDGYTEAEYEYNLSGLRKSKTVNGKRTRFVYSGADILGEITNDNYYIYYRGTELLGSKSYTGDVSFYRIDGHGSVTAVLSPTGEELKSYRYDAFGAKKAFTIPPMGERTILYQWKAETDGTYNPFGYCGEYTDTETGLIYLRNRYYNPTIGRFITEDPIKDGLNWYAYANNNPVMFVDPTGLIPSLEDAAEMASRSYNTYDMSRDGLESRKLGDGWRLIDEWKGSEGLVIHIYVRGDGEHSSYTGAKEYAFVNKGSSTWSDWANNFQQPFGWSTDMSESIAKAEYFSNGDWGNYEITFIGHSKGGAEAAANAVVTNRNAILFNPAAVALNEYGLNANTYSANMTAYVVRGEPLSALNLLLGAKAIDSYEPLPFYSLNPKKNHSMEAVKSGVKGR